MACEHCASIARAVERLAVDIDERVLPLLRTLNRKVNHMSDQQAELNQDVADLEGDEATIATAVTNITGQISALQATIQQLQQANPQVDFSQLETDLQTLDGQAQQLAAVAPASNPTPDQPPSGN